MLDRENTQNIFKSESSNIKVIFYQTLLIQAMIIDIFLPKKNSQIHLKTTGTSNVSLTNVTTKSTLKH